VVGTRVPLEPLRHVPNYPSRTPALGGMFLVELARLWGEEGGKSRRFVSKRISFCGNTFAYLISATRLARR